MNFLAELRRRNVIRVALLYAAACWLVLQVADVLLDVIGAPDWGLRFVAAVLLLLAPIVLVFSWVYELTPEGIRREVEQPPATQPLRHHSRRLGVATFVLVAAALALFGWERLPPVASDAPAGDLADGAPAQRQATEPLPALAVLPFVNLSGDPSEEYFADGIAEEILTLLAGSEGVRVISRTSAFAFKGQSLELPVIAARLGAGYVLEGSVRRGDERVRVSAQLIDAGADTRLWAETYERQIDDVFVIQSEVARDIARVLRIALGTDEIASFGTPPTTSLAAWQLFLEARYLIRTRRNPEDVERALELTERALAQDPRFARAQSLRALILFLRPGWLEGQPEFEVQHLSNHSLAFVERLNADWRGALEAAELALEVDPRLGEPHIVRALHAHAHNDWPTAASSFREALARAPNNPDLRSWYGSFLLESGYLRDGLREKQRASELDPLSPMIAWQAAYAALVLGRRDLIVEHARRAEANGWSGWQHRALQGGAALTGGDLAAAEQIFLAALPGREEQVRQSLRAVRAGSLDADSREVLATLIPYGPPGVGRFSVFCMVGAHDEAMATLYDTVAAETLSAPGVPRVGPVRPAGAERPGGVLRGDWWIPSCAALRADPRFVPFLDAIGLTDFWRAEGPPDLCEPLGEGSGLTFRCR